MSNKASILSTPEEAREFFDEIADILLPQSADTELRDEFKRQFAAQLNLQ